MTTYPLDLMVESGLSLLVLLGLYKLLLENQPMHRLKRVYLLGTLLVSLTAPLITIDVPVGTLPVVMMSSQSSDYQYVDLRDRVELMTANVPEPVNYWLWLYAAGTSLMLIRFGRNLYRLTRQIADNPTEPFRGATLVRLPGAAFGAGMPYTFLHYLFVPDVAYKRGEIEGELFTHELAHIRQHHSLDVLLVELVLCFGWFNPLFFWLKRAMQLNHEFLADAAVNTAFGNVPIYQSLLVSKLTPNAPRLSLTSTLTFQTTKQRLFMMTKHASPVRTWLAGTGSALILGTLTVLLSTRTVAQQPIPAISKVAKQQPAQQPDVADMERQFGDKLVNEAVKLGTKRPVLRRFSQLTPEEKTRVIVLRPNSRKTPTEREWKDFSNPKKYGVWVNGKRRRDNPFARIKRTDIVSYSYSYVHKNARQPEGYLYQLDMDTEEGYQRTLQDWEENPWLTLVSRERFERQKANKAN